MTPTNEGDSPFDVILTPEEKQFSPADADHKSKGLVGGFMTE